MDKRRFRPAADSKSHQPDYPTLDQFDEGRRRFLARLGGLLGATALAPLLARCGGRAVDDDPPDPLGGVPALPDARTDEHHDAGIKGNPDGQLGGVAPQPDARVDQIPDAQGSEDQGAVPPDWRTAGIAPAPDARIEEDHGLVLGGEAPLPDARGDNGSCPLR